MIRMGLSTVIAKSEIAGVKVDTDTDTELTAAAFTCNLHSKDQLMVGSLYRPPIVYQGALLGDQEPV